MKFRALVKNEFVKIFNKKSTFVFAAIILVFTFIWSVVDDKDFSDMFNDENQFNIEGAEELPYVYFLYSNSGYLYDSEFEEITQTYEEEFKSNVVRAVEIGIKSGDWRSSLYENLQNNVNQKCDYAIQIAVLEATVSNYESENCDEQDINDCKEEISMYENCLKELSNEQLFIWNTIENGRFSDYIKGDVPEIEKCITSAKSVFSQFESTLKLQNASESELKIVNDFCEILDKTSESAINAYQHAIDSDIEGTSVVISEFEKLNEQLSTFSYVTINEEPYSVSYQNISTKNAYGQYLENAEKEYGPEYAAKLDDYQSYLQKTFQQLEQQMIKPIAVTSYAISNNYEEMTLSDGARNNFRGILNFSFYEYVAYFGILLAGIIVASEYSRKTINMLVIRPVSRCSILLSKYVTVIAASLLLTAATLTVGFVFCGIRYGFADYFQPYIGYSAGAAYSVPFMLWFLDRAVIAWTSVLFVITLAFALSTITKSSAVSIIIPILLCSFIEIINLFAANIFTEAYKYLPTTYISMWNCIYNDVLSFNFSVGDILGTVFGSADVMLGYGAILMAVFSALLYVLAVAVFRRRDIK